MSEITIDFETRSRAQLADDKGVGVHKYATDPSTELLCMAYKIDDGEVRLWKPGLTNFPARLFENRTIHAHNASFESVILRETLGIDIPPSRFRCSAARCAQSGLPRSLEKSGTLLKTPVGKDKEGHALMKKLVKPDKKTGEFVGTEEEFERLYTYCIGDVAEEVEVESRLPKVQPFMEDAWCGHEAMNRRGIYIDRELCEGATAIYDEVIGDSSNTVFEITGGKIKTGGQIKKILEFANERGVNIDNLRAETLAEVLETDLDPDAREVLLLRRNVSGVAAKKHFKILDYLMADQRVRDSYVFPGTHTARAASWGVQVMNMKKMGGKGFPLRYLPEDKAKKNPYVDECYLSAIRSGKVSSLLGLPEEYQKFDPITLLGFGVRAAFCASPGKTFLFRDLSQIEVRLAHWFCMNDQMMELFKVNGDPYIDFASKFFKIAVGDVSKDQRQLSKPIVLGSNYGMGAKRLMVYAKTYGVILDEDQAQVYVEGFRRLYPKIPRLWKVLETTAMQCVLDGKRRRMGRLHAGMEGRWFYFELPSGRRIYYLDPKVVKNKKMKGFCFEFMCKDGYREQTWGGTFLENLCQACTADLANLTIARSEVAGLCPVINQHDEIGVEVDLAGAKEAGQEFKQIIEMGADWSEGLPIGSDMAVQTRWIK